MSDEMKIFGIVVSVILAIILIVVCFVMAQPIYHVYDLRQSGMARLQEAESSRKIAIIEAEAKREAAKSLAQAEIERAKGVAQANAIISDSLKNNEAYLRYLWIQGIEKNDHEVIYIPTEAGLPILEAGRSRDKKK